MKIDKDSDIEKAIIADTPKVGLGEQKPASAVDVVLPFSPWWPLVAGALLGMILRTIFSNQAGHAYNAMSSAFLLIAPFAVGTFTVYVAETRSRRKWSYYVWAPAIANALCVIGTMAILIEGLICAIIVVPLFAAVGAAGGLMMGAICRMTNWPKQAVYSFAVLPLLLGAVPPNEAGNNYFDVVERTIVVKASPEKIWKQIHEARDIKPEEVGHAWMYRIGVPLPLAGVTEETSSQLVRRITMGKSVYFDQVSSDWQVNHHVNWRYRFYEDSFPPHAMDDHVKIGGHYFDIIDTEYALTPKDAQSTELKVKMHYRINTEFNWYANPIAQLLIGNFEEVILNFYSLRASGEAAKS
jgi:hypothetical protein